METVTGQMRQRIWHILSMIPEGRVSTYGRIAALGGFPQAPRQVGRIIAQLPEATTLPWHRVVNSQGRISRRPGDSPARQRRLLEDEGVVFVAGRVNLDAHGWPDP